MKMSLLPRINSSYGNFLTGEQLREKRYQPPQADHNDAIAHHKLHLSAATCQST